MYYKPLLKIFGINIYFKLTKARGPRREETKKKISRANRRSTCKLCEKEFGNRHGLKIHQSFAHGIRSSHFEKNREIYLKKKADQIEKKLKEAWNQ